MTDPCDLCGHERSQHGRGQCFECDRNGWHCHRSSVEEQAEADLAAWLWNSYLGRLS